jgi:hypothetical protein
MIEPWLADRVRDAIETGGPADDAAFQALAVAIAQAQGLMLPDALPDLDGIDPVPETAFKLMTVAHFAPSSAQATFRTSGTTTGSPGRRLVQDLDLYRASVVRGFGRFVMVGARSGPFVSLIPPAEVRPHSSLSHMATMVGDAFATAVTWARRGDAVDLDAVAQALDAAVSAGTPVVLLGTTLDFLTLFEGMAAKALRFDLPVGSRAMHTGGSKATGRSVDREALRASFTSLLAIPEDDVVEEYGMTELLSQAYDAPRVTPGPRRLVGVPWMRTRVLDPRTMAPVATGERGVLCHYDLANFDTAVAVLTQDMATAVANGFTDIVRAPGAQARGCSAEAATRTD